MLRFFGAPVMEPPGKAAARHWTGVTCAQAVPVMVLTSVCTLAYVCSSISFGTETLPTCTRSQARRQLMQLQLKA